MFYYGSWSYVTSLPLEMCYISALLIPVYNRNRHSRILQNWFFFAGFGGSLFAFINTNLSQMDQIYICIHYFCTWFSNFCNACDIVIDGYRPTWYDYFDAIKWTTYLSINNHFINYTIGSNYMFYIR